MSDRMAEERATGSVDGADDRPGGDHSPRLVRGSDFTNASAAHFEREFDSATLSSNQAGLQLLRLATLFQNDAESRVHRPNGLRWTGFSALFALTLFERLEARSLARVVGVSRQAISLVINVLERDGFIVRTPGKDRRTMVIELTDAGRKTAAATISGQVDLSQEWFGCLSETERVQFVAMIGKILGSRADRLRAGTENES